MVKIETYIKIDTLRPHKTPLENNKKSVGITVTLQPIEQTLTDSEIDIVSDKIINKVSERTGGTLRG